MMKVKDLMTYPAVSCDAHASLQEAALQMFHSDCGILPVVDETSTVVGVITDRDIAIALATKSRPANAVRVGEVHSKSVYCCVAEDDIRTALSTMRRHKIRRLPVVGIDREVVGVISMNDIVLEAKAKPTASGLGYAPVIEALQTISEHGAVVGPARRKRAG